MSILAARFINRVREGEGAPVSVSALIAHLWNGAKEPPNPERRIQAMAAKLRRDGFPIVNWYGEGYRWTGRTTIPLGSTEYDPRNTIGALIFGYALPLREAA